jgi:hypothetical protein
MSYSRILLWMLLCLFVSRAWAQRDPLYVRIHFSSGHTAFPDTARVKDYVYDSVGYSAAGHYSDSSVLLIVPAHLKPGHHIDLICWFHGWHNNIDTAVEFYQLTKQFIASNRNAILVLAETAKNAPDSYGGKLEQPGMFESLVHDVMEELKKRKLVPAKSISGNIVLAGHSGAYRVIAHILQDGQMPVQEVFLFDALYGETGKYLNWICQDPSHHFIHWFTNRGGGTDIVSDTAMQQLKKQQTDFALTEEGAVNPGIIKNNRILFVHSPREHNVIINNPDDFQLLLENSFVLRPLTADGTMTVQQVIIRK